MAFPHFVENRTDGLFTTLKSRSAEEYTWRIKVSCAVALGSVMPIRPSILVHSRSTNGGSDRVAIADGVRQPLDDDAADPFAAGLAIGTVIEAIAFAIR